jgi:hypothetical protein
MQMARSGHSLGDWAAITKRMGMEEVITAPRSPWQNPYVERLIGSVRRECLDHVIVWNERSLRRTLRSYFRLLSALPNSFGLGQGRSGVESPGEARTRAHRSNSSGRRTSPLLPASGRLEIAVPGAVASCRLVNQSNILAARHPISLFLLHPASRIRTPSYCLAASR